MFGFDWDEANLAHIARHNVTQQEAEQVLEGALFELDTYIIDDEDRVEELGATALGRILKVISVVRNGLIRVVTAYDATKAEKLAFLDHQRRFYE